MYRIGLSDGSLFSFKCVYLPPEYQSLSASGCGQELSGGEDAALRYAASCYRAERAALRLIARAEQCGFGLSRKLESRGHPASCVWAVIAHLENLDVLSDERFALLWLRSRLGNSASPRNLLAALHRRGIDRSAARRALDAALEPEAELALLRRYLRKHRLAQDRYLRSALKYEGFSPEVIQTFLEEAPAD